MENWIQEQGAKRLAYYGFDKQNYISAEGCLEISAKEICQAKYRTAYYKFLSVEVLVQAP